VKAAGPGTTSFGEVASCCTSSHLAGRTRQEPAASEEANVHYAWTVSRSATGNTPRVYPPDLQPLLQSILAALADIDFVHASEVAIIRDSDADEWLKQSVIRRLEERHRERRTPYVRQLAAVEERIQALAA
jgi:hypothetical protein